MKGKIRSFVVLSVLLLAVFSTLTLAVHAQSPDGKGLEWWLYQDVVIDSKQTQYEEARKEIIAMLHKDRISAGEFQALALKSAGQGCVVYATPTGLGGQSRDTSNLSQDWTQVFTDLGPAYLNAWNRMRDATRVSSEYLIRFRPDLAYSPANARFKPEDQLYIQTDYYYTTPKGKANFERALKSLRQLNQSKGIETAYKIFEIVLGPEKPGYMLSTGARSQEELQAVLNSDATVLGRDGEQVMNKVRNLAAKVERHADLLRLDLSYFPAP